MVQGVLICDVEDGSEAASSGLMKNDVITSISHQKVISPGGAAYVVSGRHKLQASINLLVIRDGKELQFDFPSVPSLEQLGLSLSDTAAEVPDTLENNPENSLSSPTSVLGYTGILSLLAGLFFLFFNPLGSVEVVNLQGMFIGTSLSIVGAIFLAAEWRPR